MHNIFGQIWSIVMSQFQLKRPALMRGSQQGGRFAILFFRLNRRSHYNYILLLQRMLQYQFIIKEIFLQNLTISFCVLYSIHIPLPYQNLNVKFHLLIIIFKLKSRILIIISNMAWEDVHQYNQKFQGFSATIKSGPAQQRTCTDWFCLIFFILIFLATFGGGAFFIYQGKQQIAAMIAQSQSGSSTTGFGYVMAKLAGPIVGMMIFSSALSVGLIFCTKSCPKQTMYFLIGFNFAIYIGLAIFGFVMGSIALGVVFCIMTAVVGIVLYCLWEYMKVGLKLLQCASKFIMQKPAVYFISLMCLLLNCAFMAFWIFSWLGVYSAGVVKSETFQILTYIWYADLVFWGFFLYYCMTFLVASACAYWYYHSQNNSVLRGINNLKYHLGSICFAAIVITIITMLRVLAQSKKGSGPARLIAAFATCILSCIQDLVKVLNNYSIIVMAVTAEGYVDSAKSAISLIFDNLSLFIILDYFSNFYNLFTTFFIGLVPAFTGAGIIYKTQNSVSYAVWGGIIIFLLSIVISSIVIGMLNQALSCIYVFYCFDIKFRNMGMEVNNVPRQITNIFNEGSQNEKALEATHTYLNQ